MSASSTAPEEERPIWMSTKYIGMDVHKESISIAVMNSVGKVVMECVIETKASDNSAVFERTEWRFARDF